MKSVNVIRKGVVYKNDGQFGFSAWPTVAKLENGVLACVFSGDRVFHVCPFGKAMICYSYDNGETWTAPAAIINTPFDDRDAGICVKSNQVLLTSFNNNYAMQLGSAHKNAEHQKIAPNHKYYYEDLTKAYIELNKDVSEDGVCSSIAVSEDGGKVFSKRYSVPITTPHGPILLKDGRYFYVGRAFRTLDEYKTEGRVYNELDDGIYYMFSSDGYNWTEAKPIFKCDEHLEMQLLCEPYAVQLNNGELLVLIRTQASESDSMKMKMYQTVSSDNITNWSNPELLKAVGAPPHLIRHSSGKIICTFGCRENYGYGEKVIVSDDEGETWSETFSIDDTAADGFDLGYPASVELDDGSILTVFYQRQKEDKKNTIRYVVWNLS